MKKRPTFSFLHDEVNDIAEVLYENVPYTVEDHDFNFPIQRYLALDDGRVIGYRWHQFQKHKGAGMIGAFIDFALLKLRYP